MNIQTILETMNIHNVSSVSVVTEGTTSHVWKVVLLNRQVLAVRVVGNDQLNQLHKEKAIMNHVRFKGIQCPEVYQVGEFDGNAVMVMEWVKGETVFKHLLHHGHHAFEIGKQFGDMQADLHGISYKELTCLDEENWLTPGSSKECSIISRLKNETPTLLHLDFHPLNVMIDSPGIIDWTNCALGGYKLDIARTLSILEIHGSQYFNEETLASFIKGWRDGYESKKGSIGGLSLYIEWAGERMKRDLGRQLDEQITRNIDDWIHKRMMDEKWGSHGLQVYTQYRSLSLSSPYITLHLKNSSLPEYTPKWERCMNVIYNKGCREKNRKTLET